jgi:VWFA-related protein
LLRTLNNVELSAQNSRVAEQVEEETITFEAALVNTHVSVRDAQGHYVSGLTKDDFIVLDDGKQQPIVHFSQESNQPLRVALVIDRSRSVQSVLGRAQLAVRDFIHSVLRRGKDSACLLAFDSGVYLVQDFTDDADSLAAGVNKLTAAGGSSIFDAIYKASRDKLAGTEDARRVVVLITDGEDTTSRASLEQATEMAIRNNVAVYAIRLPAEDSLNGREQQGKPVLTRLTETTGGRQFHLNGGEGQLAGFLNKLQNELRSQYSIGYQFQSASSVSSFHKITIKLMQPALKAFTRSGYYSRSE